MAKKAKRTVPIKTESAYEVTADYAGKIFSTWSRVLMTTPWADNIFVRVVLRLERRLWETLTIIFSFLSSGKKENANAICGRKFRA